MAREQLRGAGSVQPGQTGRPASPSTWVTADVGVEAMQSLGWDTTLTFCVSFRVLRCHLAMQGEMTRYLFFPPFVHQMLIKYISKSGASSARVLFWPRADQAFGLGRQLPLSGRQAASGCVGVSVMEALPHRQPFCPYSWTLDVLVKSLWFQTF